MMFSNNSEIIDRVVSDGEKIHVGYCRVSSLKQKEDGHSLDAQKSKIKKYFKKRDIENYIIIEDPGFSGRTTERPGYKKLMDLVVSNQVEQIVVVHLDRLNRNALNSGSFLLICEMYGVRINMMDKKLDYLSAMGKFTTTMLNAMAELESDLISERTRNSQEEMALKSYYPFKAFPFGYKLAKDCGSHEEDRTLIEVTEEIKAIQYIFKNINKLKPSEIRENIFKKYQLKINEKKYEAIKKNYDFYSTGKITANGKEYQIIKPIIDIRKYGKVMDTYKNNSSREVIGKNAKKVYKYHNMIYFEGVKAKQNSSKKTTNGVEKRYYYYVAIVGDEPRRISQIDLDELLVVEIDKELKKRREKFNEKLNELDNNLIDSDKFMKFTKAEVNKSAINIEKIELTRYNTLKKIKYKKITE